jgi:2TM domain
MNAVSPPPSSGASSSEYEMARKRLHAKRALAGNFVTLVVVCSLLTAVWALTDRRYFWPGWVIGGWSILLALHAWKVLIQRPITDADVEAEIRRRP